MNRAVRHWISALCLALAASCTAPEQRQVASVPAPPISLDPPARAADEDRPVVQLPADAGAFRKCASCHALAPGKNGVGPSLAGAFGRRAGAAPGFAYSPAMQQSGVIWDAASLDRFLSDPVGMMPLTKMRMRGLNDPAERAQVIAFIERYR